ncbi:MAG TPA: SPFH/Band 7/PHB domain protein, partial [Petrotogaceae bacterium]|nr:SPFH/Band 7/PHB domain protein [Petrotogaceae bacterium]
ISVFKSIHEGNPTKDIINIKYLEALKEMSQGSATKIFMPYEVSGILSGVAAMLETNKTEPEKK